MEGLGLTQTKPAFFDGANLASSSRTLQLLCRVFFRFRGWAFELAVGNGAESDVGRRRVGQEEAGWNGHPWSGKGRLALWRQKEMIEPRANECSLLSGPVIQSAASGANPVAGECPVSGNVALPSATGPKRSGVYILLARADVDSPQPYAR